MYVYSGQVFRGSMVLFRSRGGSQRNLQENVRYVFSVVVNVFDSSDRFRYSSIGSNKEFRESRIRFLYGNDYGDLIGYYISDGIDYSLKVDYLYQINMGMFREDLVGIEDIQLVDFRGFNFIDRDFDSMGNNQRISREFNE